MKNPKLEAAQRRLFNGRTVLPNKPFGDGSWVDPKVYASDQPEWPRRLYVGEGLELRYAADGSCEAVKVQDRLQAEVNALQELLNEKDEQIDRLQRPMVVRLDWWAVGLVALVVGAHYLGYL